MSFLICVFIGVSLGFVLNVLNESCKFMAGAGSLTRHCLLLSYILLILKKNTKPFYWQQDLLSRWSWSP